MIKNFFIIFLILASFFSCSRHGVKGEKKAVSIGDDSFLYTDKNGKYTIKMNSGINQKDKSYFTKKIMSGPSTDGDKILEQSITFSELGSVRGKTHIMRPKMSQYAVWFDGKKYFSELKVNPKKKLLEIKMQSPETNWNGTKQFKFPSTKKISCFFSQIIECVRVSGFIDNAINNKKGKMNFYVIWEGYPYLNDTFSDFPSEVFSKAELEFDGDTKSSEYRFNLQVAGQSIFYMLDKSKKFKKMFWVSQGISMIEKSAVKEVNEIEGSNDE
jgi:hypothetical protein